MIYSTIYILSPSFSAPAIVPLFVTSHCCHNLIPPVKPEISIRGERQNQRLFFAACNGKVWGGVVFWFFWQWLFSVFFIFFFNLHPLNCAVNYGTKLSVTLQKDTGNDNAIQKSAWRFAPRGLSYGSTVNKILTYISAALEENLKLEHGKIISFTH